MLKITTLFIATIFAVKANAQIKKGTLLLGGQIGANSSKLNIVNTSSLPLGPQTIDYKSALLGVNIGTAFKENKIMGLNFNVLSQKEKTSYPVYDTTNTKVNIYQIGVFYRQYKKLGKDFYFYGQADLGATFGKGTRVYNFSAYDYTTKQTGAFLAVSTGVSYAVLKKLHVELTLPNLLNLQFDNFKETNTYPNTRTAESKQFSFNTILTSNNVIGNIGIGFRLFL
jgi:hypothetical protein